MKITEFLKKFSLIDNKFIDDFYSFYDDGKNEYDFTISLDLIADWLNVRKDHLKTLLISNFTENTDYIQIKESGKKGTGINNRIHVMLTYTCSKLLCMISKCEKANMVRNYYIELEKLIITYKDNIVNDLYNQLGVQQQNKEITEKNNNEGLLYILKIEDDFHKLGTTATLKARMKQYNVGRISELPIVYVYKCNNIKEVEKCVKDNLESYRVKKHKNNEIFKIDDDFIKDTVIYCNKKSIKIKENRKLLKSTDKKNWLIIIDKKNLNIDELFNPVKKYQRKNTSKNNSIKISKKTSKRDYKKNSKK